MNSARSDCPKKTFHFSLWGRIIIVSVIALPIVGACAYHFRFHLFWKYAEWRLELHEVKAIPNSPMPKTAIPEDWEEHSFNGISFRLPPDMILIKSANNTIAYQSDSHRIAIGVIPDQEEVNAFLNSLSPPSFPPSSSPVTLTQLRLECLSVGANDFRWSMTPRAAQRLGYLLTMRRLLEVNDPETTESFSRDDKEGVLLIAPRRVLLDWQSMTAPIGGYIHFFALHEDAPPLELDWIRSVCESITIDHAEVEATSECH